ncbi:MAG: ribonuclease P protein component [Anaerolineae bacterium]|nr:ribonuclease P protein component [Anaerolineae bacterium]
MHQHLRLRHPDDFLRLKTQGQVVHHPFFTISYLVNDQAHNRYGVITSKRLGKAVKRNRMRRQIREALRLLHPRLKVGFDVVVIAKQGIIGQPFSSIQEALRQKLNRVGLVSQLE